MLRDYPAQHMTHAPTSQRRRLLGCVLLPSFSFSSSAVWKKPREATVRKRRVRAYTQERTKGEYTHCAYVKTAFDAKLIHRIAESPRVAAPDEFQLILVLSGEVARHDALTDTQRSSWSSSALCCFTKNTCGTRDECTELTTTAGHMGRPRSTSAAARSPLRARVACNVRSSWH